MLSEGIKSMLQRHVDMKGRSAVVQELGISSATLSQVLNDKYPAKTDAISEKIENIYGNDGMVNCPVLGTLEPWKCAENHERACKRIKAGNPLTIRLMVACRKCELR